MFLYYNVPRTRVIRVFEAFAGIGAQHKAITNIDPEGKWFKVVKTSEWDARAVIAYAQIHHKADFEKELKKIKKWSLEKVNEYFDDKVFSLNSKKSSKINRKDIFFKKNLISANEVNKNYPDINSVSGNELSNIDMLTYSFPCQGLSIANMGRDKGIKKTSESTSNLIWQIKRMLVEAKNNNSKLPKYLLMENVKNLLSKKHKKDFDVWLKFLSSIGYVTKYFILSGLKHGSLQKRERVFAISVFKWKNQKTNEEIKKELEQKFSHELLINQRKKEYQRILKSSKNKLDEIMDATPNDTPSRKKMKSENTNLLDKETAIGKKWIIKTLTTKQDRHPNIGMIPNEINVPGKLDYRFITHRQAYLMMGFNNKDFAKVKKKYDERIITSEALYRQAGNSIIVGVLESIFKYINFIERSSND